MSKFNCPVCNWAGLDEEAKYPFSTHEICACCGCQFGLDVQKDSDILDRQNEWLSEGAPWFDDEYDVIPSKPKNWSVEIALKQANDFN